MLQTPQNAPTPSCIKLPQHYNNILYNNVFAILHPLHVEFQQGQEVQIQCWTKQGKRSTLAKIIACYQYPNLKSVSDALLALTTGIPNFQQAYELHRKYWRNTISIEHTPIAIFVCAKLQPRQYTKPLQNERVS